MISTAPLAPRDPIARQQRPIRVLLADRHAVILWGVRQLLQGAGAGMTVSGTAATWRELLSHPALHATDVVLLDVNLSDATAVDCLPELVSEGLKVVLLT